MTIMVTVYTDKGAETYNFKNERSAAMFANMHEQRGNDVDITGKDD